MKLLACLLVVLGFTFPAFSATTEEVDFPLLDPEEKIEVCNEVVNNEFDYATDITPDSCGEIRVFEQVLSSTLSNEVTIRRARVSIPNHETCIVEITKIFAQWHVNGEGDIVEEPEGWSYSVSSCSY